MHTKLWPMAHGYGLWLRMTHCMTTTRLCMTTHDSRLTTLIFARRGVHGLLHRGIELAFEAWFPDFHKVSTEYSDVYETVLPIYHHCACGVELADGRIERSLVSDEQIALIEPLETRLEVAVTFDCSDSDSDVLILIVILSEQKVRVTS